MTSAGSRLGARRQPVAYAIVITDAAVVALLFGLWLGGDWPANHITALANAGALTAWGLPVARLGVNVCAVGTVGMLVTAILLPRTDGELTDPARRCLRSAAWLALAWAAATATLLALSWSDATALPVTQLPFSQLLNGAETSTTFPEAIPYLFGAVLALIISAGAGTTQTLQGAIGLLVLTGCNLLPLTTQGHATHSTLSPYAVTVHVLAASLWVGGLAGLLIHVRGRPGLLAVAVPRFSNLALACYLAVGASGLTATLVILGFPSEAWRSGYALLALCKLAALAALGYVGRQHQRRTIPALTGHRARRAFLRLAAAEVVVMAVTVALGVALSQAPTPDEISSGQHLHAALPPTPDLLDQTLPSLGD